MRIYLRSIAYLKPYLLWFFASLLLAALFSTANVYFLPLVRDVINAINHKDLLYFHNQIFNVICLFSARLITQFGQAYLTAWISNKIIIDIRLQLYKKLQNFSQSFYSEWKVGELINRQFSDTANLQGGILIIFENLLPQTITFFGVLTYMMVLNWKLTCFSIIAIPLFVVLISKLSVSLKKVTSQAQRKMGDITHITQESISNMKLVQAYNMEDRDYRKMKREYMHNFRALMTGVKVKNKVEFSISFLQFLVITLVLWYGGLEVTQGQMTGPQLASFFTGILLMIDPIIVLSKVSNKLQVAAVSAERVFELLDTPVDIQSPENPATLEKPKGNIQFKNVSFFYNKTSGPVLNNISLEANEGDTIALVGLSGAGKSTLINMIPRFYDPSEGSITLDGQDLRTLNVHELRQHIAIVPQEDLLFRGSILENIRYGTPDATRDEVIEAAKMANAWEFIEKLPGNLRSKIGDRGRLLSGGQQQRLSIARAILRNPKILLLDEATSALDSESEKLVQDALLKLLKNRTTFVIAHRLSTIMHATKIVVIENGKIEEIGTHEDLLNQNGLYAKFYSLQFRKS